MNKILTIICLLVLNAFSIHAQEKSGDHTYILDKDAPAGKGQLKDVEWLVGSWQGTAFGSQFEEVWNPPSAGSMLGMWKLFDEDKGVNFYEIMVLQQIEDSLELRVKHFGADFTAWENKKDFVKFRLIKIDKNAVHFSGLSFYKKDSNNIDGFIVMKNKDGSTTEHKLSYSRVMH